MSAAFRRGTPVVREEDTALRPHEQVQAFLDSSGSSPDPWAADIAAVRADARAKVLAVTGEPAPVASVESVDADGVPARLYLPTGAEQEVLVWAHGGGWIHGDLDTAEGVARALANRAACGVLSIDYRLAPEHPFPAGFDDTWTAVTWARHNFGSVAVGGDSSGGNLAAAAALKARDEGVRLAAQLLVYPALDSVENTDYKVAFRRRYETFAGQSGFGSNSYRRLQHIWATYVPDPAHRKASYVSPLHAKSVRGVAPATIITAEHDFLRREAEDYARRLEAAGVPVELTEYAGQIHGFFEMFAVMTDAHHAAGKAGDAVRRAFQSTHTIEP
ncbi:alpha/beta hydrolase [Dactylosporangium sp. AC04546]|uniref:alpha/beta hydrolase n=1 Tax=Dactylosporangium sp. AC04546 TaxID=2862460 RepID=UPI001EDFFDB1|nr:alpha/beta hydrolase [Dactylosporangium sp. AC04546]WVK86616.1 alpha/beta hydrolase [Dactylosporangium sp. AC04546]